MSSTARTFYSPPSMTATSVSDSAFRPGPAEASSSSLTPSSSSLPQSPRRQTRFPLYMPEHHAPLPRSKQAQSEDVSHRRWKKPTSPRSPLAHQTRTTERTPLLTSPRPRSTSQHAPEHHLQASNHTLKKPFYRARPLWLVPFAIVAAVVRGMTLAPRVEVYTQLSCYALHGRHEYNHTYLPALVLEEMAWDRSSAISLYSSLDPLGPYLFTPPTISSNTSISLPPPEPIEPPLSSRHKHRNSTDVDRDDGSIPDPRRLPTARCLSDPAVQANTARLQTTLTITMGLLSALTTGWWGHFGERYGRTTVLAIATFGLFWTDLIFILVSTPKLPFPLSWFSYSSESNRAQHLLLLAPLVEGLLGGWSTLQSATSAYISDCTSPGSRAQIFSRFTGVFYLGFSIGPAIAAWLIRHSDYFTPPSSSGSTAGFGSLVDLAGKTARQRETVTAVFWIAVICSFMNFLLVLFVFPESLSKEKQQQARREHAEVNGVAMVGYKGKEKALDLPVTGVEDVEGVGIGAIMDVEELSSPIANSPSCSRHYDSLKGKGRASAETSVEPATMFRPESIFVRFFRPLTIFLPVWIDMPTRNGLTVKRRKDYSLTLLAAGLFAWMLSTGVYQIKYLYAGHTYRWGAEKLSYYISFMGGARAFFLLVLLPHLIATFKSKPSEQAHSAPGPSNGKGKARAEHDHHEDHDIEANDRDKGKKPPPTRLELGKAIRFDLRLSRFSLLIDIIGNLLVAIAPSPALTKQGMFGVQKQPGHPEWSLSLDQSQMVFVIASGLNSFASGMVPAVHSLALCIVQARTLEADFGGIGGHSSEGQRDQSKVPTAAPVDTGTLFGAFAVLQAVGQMILGPMLFGIVYSETVASHPKTIFVVAAGLMMFALVLIMVVKNPVGEVRLARKDKKFRKRMEAGYGAFGVPYSGPGGSGYRYVGGGKRKGKGKNWEQEIERRGRTRQSKDLRGGAIGWYTPHDGRHDPDQAAVARSA